MLLPLVSLAVTQIIRLVTHFCLVTLLWNSGSTPHAALSKAQSLTQADKCICLIVFNEINAQGAPLLIIGSQSFTRSESQLPSSILHFGTCKQKELLFTDTNFTLLILSPSPPQPTQSKRKWINRGGRETHETFSVGTCLLPIGEMGVSRKTDADKAF